MLYRKLTAVILAAGQGKRMCSTLPKVLNLIGGKTMLQHLIDRIIQLNVMHIYIIYNHNNEFLLKNIPKQKVKLNWILQSEQLGTGHAMQQVSSILNDDDEIIILNGDVPLVSYKTLNNLLLMKTKNSLNLLTTKLDNPDGYGRILRKNNEVIGIIEQQCIKNKQQKFIYEVNTGVMLAYGKYLKRWLNKIRKHKIYNEYYLTDIVSIAFKEGYKINTVQSISSIEVEGVNNYMQLARLEKYYQTEQAKKLLLSGVKLSDPNRFNLRGELVHGQDVYIDIDVIIEGKVILGDRVIIGPGCILRNTTIGNDVTIHPYSILNGVSLEKKNTIGPFVHLRSGTILKEDVKIGNFVEIKDSCIDMKTKINHLSYMGNANIGKNVNIGAGTITCNYDGVNKHTTIIDDGVFIGSNTQLIAPVDIGKNAVIGAGTTVTQKIENDDVVISRLRQFSIKKK